LDNIFFSLLPLIGYFLRSFENGNLQAANSS